jgi:hypothetical protein
MDRRTVSTPASVAWDDVDGPQVFVQLFETNFGELCPAPRIVAAGGLLTAAVIYISAD